MEEAAGPAARDVEARVLSALDALGAAYSVMPCDPEAADTAAFCARYGVAPEISANTILVAATRGPAAHAACVVLAHTRLDVNRAVRRLMGVAKASFAGAADAVRVTGMMVGGVTPFGLPPDLPVYVDSRVMDAPEVVVGGGSRSMKIRLAPSALTLLTSVRVIDGLAVTAET